MATVGFESIKIGILDDNEKVIQSFDINASKGGAINAKFSGLGATMKKTFASNVPFYVAAQGVSDAKLELQIADIPEDALAAITGATENDNGITVIGSETRPPYVAVMCKTASKEGGDIYVSMLKGKFSYPETELKTNEDQGPDLQTDTISGDFVARNSDSAVYAKGRSDAEGFTKEAYETFVFPAPAVPGA